MEREICVGVAGAGFTGVQHMEAIRRVPGLRVVALADANVEAARQKAKELGVPKIYGSVSEMISGETLDVLHNCTPNGVHAEINEMAIQQGIHVFCEKPLATRLEDADALVGLAKQKGVSAGVNFNYRSNAMVQEMRQRVRENDTGRLLLVNGQYMQDWLMKDTDYSWRLEEKAGGKSRAVADIGSHWFDTAQFVVGKPIVRVFAKLFTAHPTRKKPVAETQTFSKPEGDTETVPVDTEDGGFIIVAFEGGLLGNVLLSQVSGGYKNALELCVSGENYAMRWEQELPDRLFVGTQKSVETVYCSPESVHQDAARYATLPAGHVTAWSDALRNNIREYYSALRRNDYQNPRQSYSTFSDAAQIMRVVDACLRSNRQGTWVDVEG